MDELKCSCIICAENELNMWRQYANRILREMTYFCRLKWFKTPEGMGYLDITSAIRNEIKKLKEIGENKVRN